MEAYHRVPSSSGTFSGGTLGTVINMFDTAGLADLKLMADPYLNNPAGTKYAMLT
jgi:hypothetical protein